MTIDILIGQERVFFLSSYYMQKYTFHKKFGNLSNIRNCLEDTLGKDIMSYVCACDNFDILIASSKEF